MMAVFEHGTSRIYYEVHGSGDPVLLLPGFAVSMTELSALREALAARYRVISADLPGSGRSGPQPREYTPAYFEEDARSFAALLRHLETGPGHLVGYSDGGEVSMLMAAMTPDLVRSVATWGAAGTIPEEQLPLLDAFYDVVDNPIEPLQGFSEQLKAEYGEANARAMTRSFMNAIRAIIEGGGGDISLSRAGGITCPVLLIVGEHDFFVSPALVAQVADRIPSAEVIRVEGAGHGVHEDRPEWLARTLIDWLTEHQIP
ncbi:MAG TPA: alpha/beta hydrolase [Rubrobacter sp.]|nr:alpha/beta hydrolase [Rubrobacter sp.]